MYNFSLDGFLSWKKLEGYLYDLGLASLVGDLTPNGPLFQENGVVWEGTGYRTYRERDFPLFPISLLEYYIVITFLLTPEMQNENMS